MVPVRLALIQESIDAFLRVGELAGRGHHLDRVRVSLRLVQVDLRVQGLLADALARRRPPGHPVQQIVHGVIELIRRYDAVDQAPVECGPRVDHVTGQGELHRALAPDVPRDRDHRRVAEPASLAAGSGEARLLAGHRQVRGRDQLTTRRRGQAVHPRHHRLRHLLHQRHQLGAGAEQLPGGLQVGAGHVGEVVPGAEHRAVTGQHDTERVAVTNLMEGGDQFAHVGERKCVPALRAVHRDRGEVAGALDEYVLHGSHYASSGGA
jgi:hypothetical protein